MSSLKSQYICKNNTKIALEFTATSTWSFLLIKIVLNVKIHMLDATCFSSFNVICHLIIRSFVYKKNEGIPMFDDTRRVQKELGSCNHRNSWIAVRYVTKPKGKYVNSVYRITALKTTM